MSRNRTAVAVAIALLLVAAALLIAEAQGPSYVLQRSVIASISGPQQLVGEGYQLKGIAGQPVVAHSDGDGAYSIRHGYPPPVEPNEPPVITALFAPLDPIDITDQS
ncbi:hypothetical protein ACFLWA_12205, partial [Chloroflexota bacterium]